MPAIRTLPVMQGQAVRRRQVVRGAAAQQNGKIPIAHAVYVEDMATIESIPG